MAVVHTTGRQTSRSHCERKQPNGQTVVILEFDLTDEELKI